MFVSHELLAILAVFLPLLSSGWCGCFCVKSLGLDDRLGESFPQRFSCLALVVAAVCAWLLFLGYDSPCKITLIPWISFASLGVDWAIYVDKLTATMFVVVNTVSAAVHIYSLGYMAEDPSKRRYFCYLSLFTFFMLLLVSSSNFLQLFCGWEGVGVCSYLLIGFWFRKNSANLASMKAFIVNRIGDFGLLIGICAIYMCFKTLDFEAVFDEIYKGNFSGELNFICLMLFLGCMGKSAQLGLHTWLPDAMAGPTPVSALIHAATMVTAGVFLVARCYPLFELAPLAKDVVLVVGALTSIFAASVAIVQNDIKKIIAYSTCSQLGYMFMACGSGDYSAAIFHLATHAFFKALLFLGAGGIIYASHHEQDIRNLRCNWKDMPVVYFAMWVGSLALGGFFPFAGFYSKDLIIESLHVGEHHFAHVVALIVAALTVIYSLRVIIVVFHQPKDVARNAAKHYLPPVMNLPLVALMLLSCVAGFAGKMLLLEPVAHDVTTHYSAFWGQFASVNQYAEIDIIAKLKPVLISAGGFIIACLAVPIMFSRAVSPFRALELVTLMIIATALISPWATAFGFCLFVLFRFTDLAYRFLLNHWYFNELYNRLFVVPARCLGYVFWKFIDIRLIDDLGPNGASALSLKLADRVSGLYNGKVLDYGLFMIVAIIVMLTVVVLL